MLGPLDYKGKNKILFCYKHLKKEHTHTLKYLREQKNMTISKKTEEHKKQIMDRKIKNQ